MADRKSVRLDDKDLIAAAQILSWIARPHRPQSGVDLLNQWFWARRRHRGETVPPLPFALKKPNRLVPQLDIFKLKTLEGFQAGIWFERRVLAAAKSPMFDGFNATIRGLARLQIPLQRRDAEAEGNVIRDIWSRRKPIAHLAIASANQIAAFHESRGMVGFNLEMTIFDPVWVPAALDEAESRARGSFRASAFKPGQLMRFHRDSRRRAVLDHLRENGQ